MPLSTREISIARDIEYGSFADDERFGIGEFLPRHLASHAEILHGTVTDQKSPGSVDRRVDFGRNSRSRHKANKKIGMRV
jgi:hypothetical protein